MTAFTKWLIFLALCAAFPIGAMVTAWLVRPRGQKSPEKLMPYECGVDPSGPAWKPFKINYFKYALVFILFDVETLFLYPWAVKFKAVGWFAFAEMVIFILILVLGLWYAWKEGALEWD